MRWTLLGLANDRFWDLMLLQAYWIFRESWKLVLEGFTNEETTGSGISGIITRFMVVRQRRTSLTALWLLLRRELGGVDARLAKCHAHGSHYIRGTASVRLHGLDSYQIRSNYLRSHGCCLKALANAASSLADHT